MRLFLPGLLLSIAASLIGCGGGSSPQPGTSSSNNSNTVSSTSTNDMPSQTLSQATRPKIVAFGDSLTAGYGLAPAESYPSLLQRKLDADGYAYEVVNAGVSGDTSAGGVRRIDWSLDGDVRFVILELGANDFLRGQPVSETKKNLANIIERAKSHGAKVLLAGMYTPTSSGRDYELQIRDLFQSLSKEQDVPMIPFFLEGVAGIESLNQTDRVHPNAKGTKIVANVVYKHLKPLLDAQPEQSKKN